MTEPGIQKKKPASTSSASCPLCHGAGFVRVDVPPGHPDFGRAVPCHCVSVQRQQRRMSALLEASNLGLLTRMTFDSFVPGGHGLNPHVQDNLRRAFEKARAYADNPQGWLVFKGSYGCGKTHLAAAIANEQVARGQPALFVVVPDLLDYLRAAFSPGSPATFDQRFETLRTTPLLILDDLGAHSSTPWAQEKLFQILNYRYNAQLPTVITTNCELDMFDPRLRSRLMELDWSTMVQILAPDFRGSAVVEQSELSSLGLHKDQTFESFDLREGDPALDAGQKSNLRRALATARAYAEEPTGWLVLTGGYGCGKTHLAAAIANQCVDSGNSAIFVVVPDLLDHLRAAFAPGSTVTFDRRFDEIRRAPMLVIDDLGSQSATPWAQEKLFQLFDHRYNAVLPTVVTMTRDVDLDPRLKTRIMDTSRCRVLEITAPSYRGEAHSSASENPRAKPSPARGRRGLGVAR